MSGQQGEDQAAKLTRIISAAIGEHVNRQSETNQLQLQALQVQLGQVELQLRTVIKLLEEGGATKPKTRTKKTAETVPEAPSPVVETAPAPAPVEGTTFTSKNPYHWWVKEFKDNAAFRGKYLTPAALDLMKDDQTINKKKTDAEKHAPQAKVLWNHYKQNDKTTYDAIVAQFKEAERLHNEANKPVPQQKEPNSPAN